MALHHNRTFFVFVSLISVLALSQVLTGCGETTDNLASSNDQLPMETRNNGYSISITAVETTSDASLVTVQIRQLPDSPGPDIWRYAGATPGDITLRGFDWRGAYLGSRKPLTSNDSIVGFEEVLEFTLPQDTAGEVSIAYNRLRFASEPMGGEDELIDGPWTFDIPSSAFVRPDITVVDVSGSTEAHGIKFALNTITAEPDQTIIAYGVTSTTGENIDEESEVIGIVAQLPDKSFMLPNRIERADDDGVSHAYFEPLPRDQDIQIILQPILRKVERQTELSIQVDGAALSAAERGSHVPAHASAMVGPDEMVVKSIDVGDGTFELTVANSQPDTEASVLLRFPNHGGNIVLRDDAGTTYHLLGVNSNLHKSDPVTMWPGETRIAFAGPVPSSLSTLTLRMDEYGVLERGPWKVEVHVPGAGS